MTNSNSKRSESLQRPIDLLRQKLSQAEILESTLIRWLKDRAAIPAGTPGLQCVSPKRIQIILEEWDALRAQLL
jgi:hypothetical protein